MNDRPLISYRPNPLLARLYRLLFEHIEVDDAWLRAVREAKDRGTVVYVLRNLSFVDFLALDHLTKRYHLPEIRFANDLGLWVLEPMGNGWLNALRPRTPTADAANLERALATGASSALFLKRPPHLLETSARGKIEGDDLIRALFDIQRRNPERILLVPQVFVWSRSAGTLGSNLSSTIFGSSEWPGHVRSVAQFLGNRRDATLRAGEPVDLREFLSREGVGATDDILVRRLTYTLLRRLERERRAIIGPAKKPPDRLREEVLRSPKLQKVIADMAGEGLKERAVISGRARAMLRELEAQLDMSAVVAFERVITAGAARMFSAVEVDEAGIEQLRACSKEGNLVLLPSHKSHMDYMVLSWLLYRHKLPLPLVAAGDNLNFFPMGPLFRRAGAFFIRRTFGGDRLYAAVVDAYVRRMLRDGSALEFFLEGGRSRTGKLLPPRLGLLSLVVDAALGVPARTTWFCPVSIGYERFVEEKAFVHELSGGEKKEENVGGLVRSMDVFVGRYGRLSVQFGKPMRLSDILLELDPTAKPQDIASLSPPKRRAVITRLAYRTMNEINAVTAVTAGSLVATALLAHDRPGLAHGDLVDTCDRLSRTLRRSGARFSASLADRGPSSHVRAEALRDAIELFARAGNVNTHRVGSDTIYVVPAASRMSLDLAKNGIIHFFAARALIATALLSQPGPPLPATPHPDGPSAAGAAVEWVAARERVLALSRLFKYEFMFRSDAPFERIFEEEILGMQRDGELGSSSGAPGSVVLLAPEGPSGRDQITLYARLLENFLEGYRVAARGLAALLRAPLANKDLVKRALVAGERMVLAGEISRPEAVSRPLIENAYTSFVDQGYLARDSGKVTLTESYATAGAVATIESRIAAMGAFARTPPT
jgi:glycerol-3-phosphate O-acyltransferase